MNAVLNEKNGLQITLLVEKIRMMSKSCAEPFTVCTNLRLKK